MPDSRSSPLLSRFFIGIASLVAAAAAGGAVLAPAASAGAAVQAATPPPSPTDTHPPRDTAAPRQDRFSHMAARLLALSLHDTLRFNRITAGDTAAAAAMRMQDRSELKVSIATLPDPVDSHEDWLFDAFLESIRRAHERSGYVVDRTWLPWSLRTDSTLRDADRTPVRRLYPGVLLFRSRWRAQNAEKPRWRVVLLVGEVPTAGPHPRSLARALADRDGMMPPVDSGGMSADILDVLGPTFSGSAYGLRTALSKWIGTTHRTVRITTGSATSPALRSYFLKDSGFVFESTINSDAALAQRLRALVDDLGLAPNQLAVVAEGSTYYGQAFVEAAAPNKPPGEGNAGEAKDSQPLRLFFPLNIASLRGSPGAARSSRAQGSAPGVALNLTDAPRPMEAPLPTSELTSPTVDIVLDQLARTLRNHDIRAVTIAASDIRDRIFLVTQLRSRLRDVRFIILESNQLYLAPRFNADLRGTLVLSSYPMILESQLWAKPDYLVPFSDETAQGLYNAALQQLGEPSLIDFTRPNSSNRRRFPPVWTSVIGGSGLMPLTVTDIYVDAAAATADTADLTRARSDPRLDFLELAIVLGLSSVSLWLLYRNWMHLRKMIRRKPSRSEYLPNGSRKHARKERIRVTRAAMGASLRGQEMLYRFLLVAAVGGGLIPPTVVITFGIIHSLRGRNALLAVFSASLGLATLLLALVFAGFALFRCWRRERDLLRRRREIVLPARRREWPAHGSPPGSPPGSGLEETGSAWFRRNVRAAWTLSRDMWTVNAVIRMVILTLGMLYLLGTIAYAVELGTVSEHDPVRFTLLFYRAWRTDSGVSPLVPLGLAAATFVTWCGWHLRRTTALQRMTAFEAACLTDRPAIVLMDADAKIPDPILGDFSHWTRAVGVPVLFGVRRVRERLFRIIPLPLGGWVVLGIFVPFVTFFTTHDRTLESVAGWTMFEWLYRFGLAGVVAVTAWGVFRLFVVWSALKRTLRAIGGTPLITAFERLPQRISRLTRLGFVGVPRSTVIAPVASAQWHHLHRLSEVLEIGSPPESPPLSAAEEQVREEAIAYGRGEPPYPGLGACGDEEDLGKNFLALTRVLERAWQEEPMLGEVGDVNKQVENEAGKRLSEPSTSGRFRRTFSADLGLWLRTAEEFAAVHVVDYVEWVISQLRTLAGFLFVSVVLLTVHVNSYQFVPESLAKLLLFTILVVSMVVVLMVMVEMNRDEVLSRIARTEPGKVSWDWQFVLNLVLFGLVPLLTLISSEFPGVRDFLFAWVPAISRLAGGG